VSSISLNSYAPVNFRQYHRSFVRLTKPVALANTYLEIAFTKDPAFSSCGDLVRVRTEDKVPLTVGVCDGKIVEESELS